MTALDAASGLVDEVAELLADRVPARMLDRVMHELVHADRDESDDDLRTLLEQGCVTGSLRVIAGHRGGAAYLVGVRTELPERLVSRVRMHAEAYRIDLSVCTLGPTVWILLPASGRYAVAALLDEPGLSPLLALGRDLTDLRLTPAHRASLDELLDVGHRRGWHGLAEHQGCGRPCGSRHCSISPPGSLSCSKVPSTCSSTSRAIRSSSTRSCSGSLPTVTPLPPRQRCNLHVNTVRYRLRRVQEVTGVDLSDWDQRWLAELQLRLGRDIRSSSDISARTSDSRVTDNTYPEGRTA